MYTLILLLVTATASLTAAQSSALAALGIPSCADTCFTQAIGNTSCGATDYYCQCTTGRATFEAGEIASVPLIEVREA